MSAPALQQAPVSVPRQLSDKDLAEFQRISMKTAGIELDDSKRLMVYSRFSKRLRTLGIPTFAQYLELVEDRRSGEMEHFINTITTNLTYFFRETHHFEYLAATAMPQVIVSNKNRLPVRIWSAGCSLGAEPYSLAISLQDAGYNALSDYRILCTDIDSEMVAHTEAGTFSEDETRGLSAAQRLEWFESNGKGSFVAKAQIRQAMICKLLNLFGPWPIRPGVDIIFCRNVLIYFNRPAQDRIIREFASVQNSGAFLFLGHSESPRGMHDIYERVSHTVYQRL